MRIAPTHSPRAAPARSSHHKPALFSSPLCGGPRAQLSLEALLALLLLLLALTLLTAPLARLTAPTARLHQDAAQVSTLAERSLTLALRVSHLTVSLPTSSPSIELDGAGALRLRNSSNSSIPFPMLRAGRQLLEVPT